MSHESMPSRVVGRSKPALSRVEGGPYRGMRVEQAYGRVAEVSNLGEGS